MLGNRITIKISNTNKGSFNNHVDKILTICDPLLPSNGQTWKFQQPLFPIFFYIMTFEKKVEQLSKMMSIYFLGETKFLHVSSNYEIFVLIVRFYYTQTFNDYKESLKNQNTLFSTKCCPRGQFKDPPPP